MTRTTSDRTLLYNIKDSIVQYEIAEKFFSDLDKPSTVGKHTFRDTYNHTIGLYEPCMYMQSRGIKVDMEALNREKVNISRRIDDLGVEINRLCNREINPNSPQQLQKYFYIEKGIPPYTKINDKKESVITCDDKALLRIARGTSARAGLREAALIQEWRKLSKLKGTYLEITFDADSRLRCSYNPRGTRFARLSSSKTIFDTGMNMQNLHPAFLSFLVADTDNIFLNLDKRQAEWIVVAYVSGDENMISAVESGVDVHAYTASKMFKLSMDLIKIEDKLLGHESDPDNIYKGRITIPELKEAIEKNMWLPRTMSMRQCGKKCVTGDTEVLTPNGWVPISVFNWQQDYIAQWSNDIISFVKPSAMYIGHESDNLVHLTAPHVDQIVTKNHKLLIRNDRSKEVNVISAKNLSKKTHWHLPTCGKLINSNSNLLSTDEIRLLVAIQADGTIDSYNNFILRVDKERKVIRAKELLDRLYLRYSHTTRGYFIHNSNDVVIKLSKLLGRSKLFGSYLLFNRWETLKAFIDEIPKWDGYEPKRQYFTTVRRNAEWVQTIAHLTGERATIIERKPTGFGQKNLFWVKIGKATGTSLVTIIKNVEPGNKTVYCPTVQSGFFVVRRNGKISITGNSNHGLNYDETYKMFSLINEITEKEAKVIVDFYHTTYPGIRRWYDFIKRELQKGGRVLENLFGRPYRFLGSWDSDLWKSAYSYIPQSTVGELVNRGVEEIYQDKSEALANTEIMQQVHDNVLLQQPLGSSNLGAAILAAKRYMEPTLRSGGREFTIATDLKVGFNLRDMIDVPMVEDANQQAKLVREAAAKLKKESNIGTQEVR